MKEPNFFIIGSPRCGTTSLCRYLSENPLICFSRIKEPMFFADDVSYAYRKTLGVTTFNDYLDLFNKCSGEEVAIGEGSTAYLWSKVAINNIYKSYPNAKIIIMIRNPINIVCSFHALLFMLGEEDECDFEKAWNLQMHRKNGKCLPKRSSAPELLQYSHIGKLGEHVEKVFSIFPREQVSINFFDDFKMFPITIYKNILKFLNVPYDGRTNFFNANPGRGFRFPHAVEYYRKRIPLSAQEKVDDILDNYGLIRSIRNRIFIIRKRRKDDIDPIFKNRLIEFFRDDIRKLSTLIGKDITYWLSM